ncbi:MAG: hypothetical protein AAF560_33235 [Acidobacteriota bacterium]
MKKALLIVLLLLPVLAVTFVSSSSAGNGHWDSMATLVDCGPHSLCAEWYEPGSSRHGTLCCIDRNDLSATSFSACQRVVRRGPRGGGNMI